VKAVILAGGKGRRLAPYTTVLPKPLLPVGEMPILEILLLQLKSFGIEDISLCVGYLGSLIQAYFGKGERYGINIEYSFESQPLGTAGPLKLVEGLSEPFLVMNGDLLTTINFREFIQYHLQHGQKATVSLAERIVRSDFGVVEYDQDGSLLNYREKPETRFFVSMGVYIFHPGVLKFIERGAKLDLPDLVLKMKQAGEVVKTYIPTCQWLDIGRPEDYDEANRIMDKDKRIFLGSAVREV
jgi:NDP-sugar pyrophosphorylase family protein